MVFANHGNYKFPQAIHRLFTQNQESKLQL